MSCSFVILYRDQWYRVFLGHIRLNMQKYKQFCSVNFHSCWCNVCDINSTFTLLLVYIQNVTHPCQKTCYNVQLLTFSLLFSSLLFSFRIRESLCGLSAEQVHLSTICIILSWIPQCLCLQRPHC